MGKLQGDFVGILEFGGEKGFATGKFGSFSDETELDCMDDGGHPVLPLLKVPSILRCRNGHLEDELRQVCERTAGRKLPAIFDYVYTTLELDYTTFLGYGGLTVGSADRSFDICPADNPDALQTAIRTDWVK